MINVVFPVKYCSSSPVLRAARRTKALGAVLSLAPGAGAQVWLRPHPLPGLALVGTGQAKAKGMLRHRALPALGCFHPFFFHYPHTCPQQAQPSSPAGG